MTKSKLTYIAAFIAVIISLFPLMTGGGTPFASAATSSYSDALEDLSIDENFNLEDYPAVYNDYSLQVIQIAESTSGELFVYVYQPAANVRELTATTLRVSTDRAIWNDYKLELLNQESVFQKYKVNGLKIAGSSVRYYDIAAIHRNWVRGIDDTIGNENTVNEVVYEVSQLWTLFTVNGIVSYEMTKTDVVTITDKYVGFIRYSNGFKLYQDSCDSHFIAFSTDYKIDNLSEADVSYSWHSVGIAYAFGNETTRNEGKLTKADVTLTYDDIGGNRADGWWADTVKYHRIESASEFAENEGFDTETKQELKQYQWVLRFVETAYIKSYDLTALTAEKYVRVSEVSILRLKFETDGVTYNLGVVDNKQTGSKNPILEITSGFWEWLAGLLGVDVMTAKIIFAVAVILIVLAIAMPILSAIFPVFGQALKIFFKGVGKVLKVFFKGLGLVFYYLGLGLWTIISAPFRLIANAAKKREAAPAKSKSKSKTKAGKKRRTKARKKKGGKK